MVFDGVNDILTVAPAGSLNAAQVTIEAWVLPATVKGWQNVLLKQFTKNTSTGLTYALYANSGTDGGAGAYIRPTGMSSDQHAANVAPLSANEWHHIAATYNGSFLRLYVDGFEVANRKVSTALSTSALPLTIGGNVLGRVLQGDDRRGPGLQPGAHRGRGPGRHVYTGQVARITATDIAHSIEENVMDRRSAFYLNRRDLFKLSGGILLGSAAAPGLHRRRRRIRCRADAAWGASPSHQSVHPASLQRSVADSGASGTDPGIAGGHLGQSPSPGGRIPTARRTRSGRPRSVCPTR